MNFYRLKSVFFIISSCFILQTAAFAQSNVKITIKKKNITLREASREVKKQSDYLITFNESKLEKTERVNLNINVEALDKTLTSILSETGLSYKIKDKYIMIIPQSEVEVEHKKLSGIVRDDKGDPLIGINVSFKDSPTGTVTGLDGRLSILAARGDVIGFSYVGYITKYITVGDVFSLTVVLDGDAKALDEVVVTVLGIKRAEKAPSYSVQQIRSDAINSVKDANFVDGLTGKVAGVSINRSSSGIDGAIRVVMRGAKSIVGNNNVLHMVDGMPIGNPSKGEINSDYSTPGGGEGISDFNPEDIESLSILTGPATATLYGLSAANGVILISAKKGQEGKLRVSISNNTEFMAPYITPEFQNQYGNAKGPYKSWGEILQQPSTFRPKDFFETGANIMSATNFSIGNKNNQTFASVAATNSTGIIPSNEYYRYDSTLRNTTSVLNDKLRLDLGISYVLQSSQNILSARRHFNPLVPLHLFPRGEDFEAIRMYERYNTNRRFFIQEWSCDDQGLNLENPYWIVNHEMLVPKKKYCIFYANVEYNVLSWLNIAGHTRMDNTNTTSKRKPHALTIKLHAQSDKGAHNQNMEGYQQTYADIMLSVNKNLGNFNLTANARFSYEDHLTTGMGIGGKLFTVPNLFSAHNFDPSSGPGSQSHIRTWNNSMFVSTELGYRSMLCLILTRRQEWASQLVNSDQLTYFYPPIGVSSVISRMVSLPKFISSWKIRASFAEVGGPINYAGLIPRTVTDPMKGGIINPISIYPFPNFKAEQTKSYELGTNLRLFNNEININAAVYLTDTYSRTLLSSMFPALECSGFYVQAGRIHNKGIELSLGHDDRFGKIRYATNLTYTVNQNKIMKMVHDYGDLAGDSLFNITELTLQNKGGVYLREKDAIEDVYVKNIPVRDKNGKLIEEGGGYKVSRSQRIKIGSVNPDLSMGWRHNVTWNNLTLDLLFNRRSRGIVTSSTQVFLDSYGVSKDTYKARQNSGAWANGTQYDVEKYYTTISDEQLVTYYAYKATNIRLQEASLNYTLPGKWFGNVINQLTVSAIGRNLWMICNRAPFDPEMTSSIGIYNWGDVSMPPSLRSVGFSVEIKL